jgi:O-antigen/teichoic acid export membrane protein
VSAFRLLIAVPLLCIAGFLLIAANGALTKIFAEYKDSDDSTYLIFGSFAIFTASLLAFSSFLAAVGEPRSYVALLVAILAFAATPLPYSQGIGSSIGYAINLLLAVLAICSATVAARGRQRFPGSVSSRRS